jgi:undecaprenyl-diphosphatase
VTTTTQILILGVLQGLTEFLPVSSSGHLVLGKALLALKTPEGPLLEVVLHVGSMLSIMAYYRRRLAGWLSGLLRRDPEARALTANVLTAAIPVLVVYPVFGKHIEAQFSSPRMAAAMLCVTGLVLLSTRFAPLGSALPRPVSALGMGLAQAMALLPGISRSGSTLAAARWQRLAPGPAAELSFLMVLPLLAGAALLHVPDALAVETRTALPPGALAAGLAASAVVGYGALALLVRVFSGTRFYWFGAYCLAVGVLGLCLADGG